MWRIFGKSRPTLCKGLSDEAADRGGIVEPGHVQDSHEDSPLVPLVEKDDQFTGAAPKAVQALHNQFVAFG